MEKFGEKEGEFRKIVCLNNEKRFLGELKSIFNIKGSLLVKVK